MRHGNYDADPTARANWRIIRHLVLSLHESHNRVLLALLCLLLAKGAILLIPFLLKHFVDTLDSGDLQALAPALLLGLVTDYGAARFANVFFSELRDTVFGRVAERAMRRIGLQVFRHVRILTPCHRFWAVPSPTA
jgi:ATP-binding cassette, subfamily B, heavy metal transporter